MSSGNSAFHSLTKHLTRRDRDYQQLPTEDVALSEIQNVKESRVYVFGETDIAEEEINNDDLPEKSLRDRGKSKRTDNKTQSELLVDREISEDDTLQSLSLKYGCPVSELKRVNNLMSDQDFYALKYIKVPMKRHGLLQEMVEREQLNQPLSEIICHTSEATDVSDYDMDDSGAGDQQELIVRKIGLRGPVGKSGRNNHLRFLDQMDKDITKIVSSTRTRLDSLEKVVEKITCKTIQPLKRKSSTSMWRGADCGMRWWSIVLVMFLIGLVTPLLYFVYYEFVKPQG